MANNAANGIFEVDKALKRDAALDKAPGHKAARGITPSEQANQEARIKRENER